jgi:hypothetical protein
VPAVGFGLLEIAGRQHHAYGLAEVVLSADDVQQKRARLLQPVANVEPTVVVQREQAFRPGVVAAKLIAALAVLLDGGLGASWRFFGLGCMSSNGYQGKRWAVDTRE